MTSQTIPPIQAISVTQAERETLMEGVNIPSDAPQIVQESLLDRVTNLEALFKDMSRDLLITNKLLRIANDKISRLETANFDD